MTNNTVASPNENKLPKKNHGRASILMTSLIIKALFISTDTDTREQTF